ncbi:MAG TPA: isoprenylcysteine carboxylmethyltransferase family protein [Acidimicrobiales bacterium]|nr:isoprenylcysteine carboxylmethyltransferase family protein [Acidimicrobiales bacterium]
MSDAVRGWLFVAAQAALLAVLVFAPGGDDWVVSGWMRAVGTIGRLGGAAFIVIGGVRLGVGASVHPEPTSRAILRTTGPYRFVRHPIYSGVLALAAAIALTSGSWAHVAAFVALVIVLAVKARFEERLLVRRFEGYATYAAGTGRFVPGVGRGVSGEVEPGT